MSPPSQGDPTFDEDVLDPSDGFARWAEILESFGPHVRERITHPNNYLAGFGQATARLPIRRLDDLRFDGE